MMTDLLVTEMKITIIPFKSTDKPASVTAVAFHPLTEKAEPNLCVCVCVLEKGGHFDWSSHFESPLRES